MPDTSLIRAKRHSGGIQRRRRAETSERSERNLSEARIQVLAEGEVLTAKQKGSPTFLNERSEFRNVERFLLRSRKVLNQLLANEMSLQLIRGS